MQETSNEQAINGKSVFISRERGEPLPLFPTFSSNDSEVLNFAKGARVGVVVIVLDAGEKVGQVGFFASSDC